MSKIHAQFFFRFYSKIHIRSRAISFVCAVCVFMCGKKVILNGIRWFPSIFGESK